MKNIIGYYVVGLSYKNADLLTRGKFSLSKNQINLLLEHAKADGLNELMVISTCNRTELYGIVEDPQILIDYLCKFSQGTQVQFNKKGYVLSEQKAINHVFQVGCGLVSQIIGDFDYFIRLSQYFKFCCIDKPLSTYRVHSSNLSSLKSHSYTMPFLS